MRVGIINLVAGQVLLHKELMLEFFQMIKEIL